MDHGKGNRGSSSSKIGCTKIFLRMYQNFLKMYLGFQCSFRGGEQPPITSQGSPDDQMDHEKGYKGPVAQ